MIIIGVIEKLIARYGFASERIYILLSEEAVIVAAVAFLSTGSDKMSQNNSNLQLRDRMLRFSDLHRILNLLIWGFSLT